jgi:hypothetical protein
MPTVLRAKGYRIGFFMGDRAEPAHVHAARADGRSAKFWVAPVRLARNFGLRQHELAEVADLIGEHQAFILEKWNEAFGE